MGSLGVSVFFLVMLVQFNLIYSKPLFFDLICDLICDDDDDSSTSTTTSASTEDDYLDFDDWCSCTRTTRRPPGTRRNQGNLPAAINMILPPSNGMNLTMFQRNGAWTFDLNAVPNGFGNRPGASQPPTTRAPTTAAATTAAAVTTTAAPK